MFLVFNTEVMFNLNLFIVQAQVDIVHVPANKKNAADEKLKQLMRRYVTISILFSTHLFNISILIFY